MSGGDGGGVAYLLHGCVAHGVGVVVVVDDLEVSDGVGFAGGAEVNLRFSLTCSFSVDGEVSGFAHLHTCTGEHRKHISTQPRQEVTLCLLPVGSSSPVLLSPGPSARTLAASCEGSTFILKGLMGISCCARGLSGVSSHLRVLVTVHLSLTWSANSTMMVYCPGPGGVYFTVNVSLSFLMMSKSMSASAGPTTPGAHLIPMLTSPAGRINNQSTLSNVTIASH